MKKYLIAGLLVWLPLAVTIWVLHSALGLLDGMFDSMLSALQVVGFGVLLGHDTASVTTSALFGFIALVWGGSLGSGIASSLAVPEPVGLGSTVGDPTPVS